MSKKVQITCGADPEVFLTNLNGEFVSSIGRIGGSKMNPLPLPLGEGYAVQEDNVAMEFNIPPASDVRQFLMSINQSLDFLGTVVCSPQGMLIAKNSAVSFPDSELQDPQALEFGCEPDYNAYTGEKNPRPKATDASLRSCGGHVHIGYDKSQADIRSVMKMMDLHVGVPSVLMDHTGGRRRKLYGKPGAYRDKSYGGEYRTLSNFWIFDNRLITWVWNNTERAVQAAVERLSIGDQDEAAVVQAINDDNKEVAQYLINKYALEVV